MEQAPAPEGLPPSLRFLKWLVIVLMITLIIGVITVVAVIVTRMPHSFAKQSVLPSLPDKIALPQGAVPQAVTFGDGWTAIVTQDARILVFGTDGTLKQQVQMTPIP
jgi:Flp pilus assembly protein protease CpaA